MSVAETVCPSVRGTRKVLTVLALGTSGLLAASLASLPLAWLWVTIGGEPVGVVGAAIIGGIAVVLDVAKVRPPAVHRQVPQSWGHRYGPVRAAVRYGLRLGLGPATILTTWTWWAALAIAVTHGVGGTFVAMAAYVVARTAGTVAVGRGVSNGVAMAARMARVVALSRRVRSTAMVVVSACSLVGLIMGSVAGGPT